MATKTQIVNIALQRIGHDKFESNVDTSQTKAGLNAQLLWDIERQFVLRDFPWPFARKYLLLTLDAGSVETPANPDWIFAYTFPSDSVFVRRLVTCAGRQECSPPPFVIGRKAVGSSGNRLIYTNLEEAMAEYTVDITDPEEFDETFVSMFAWRLASKLAAALARNDELAKSCEAKYQEERAAAMSRAVAEGEYAIPSGEADPRIRDLFNLAITRIGVSRNVAAVDSELTFANLWPRVCFHDERDYVLRDFPWPFATRYATLVLAGGSETFPANRDWTFAYRLPSDCLFSRRLVREGGRLDTEPPSFKRGRNVEQVNTNEDLTITLTDGSWVAGQTITLTASDDLFLETEVGNSFLLEDANGNAITITITAYVSATVVQGTATEAVPAALRSVALDDWTRQYSGAVIFTDEEEAELEYTCLVDDPDEWDEMFFSLLAWRIAALLAPSTAKGKDAERRADRCQQQYEIEKTRVARAALSEREDDPDPDAEWIRGR